PETRVVYVDNDPIVLAHARALLPSQDVGETAFIMADLRQPKSILDHPTLTQTLDLRQPVAVVLVGVLRLQHHLRTRRDDVSHPPSPAGLMRRHAVDL
ncbi:MAG TPA: SAM-dependent methyltransferase, partial [Actinomycetota bacterium]|nr:SAM-dependent methyltransferase [Actinomycetota bacterium]